uniref:Peptidase S54 rhomboid domain-containing protein n=1 Tax=Eutreptiella gymnastica TaxID=73025 RepID=A0A7S1N2X2_9EUGL
MFVVVAAVFVMQGTGAAVTEAWCFNPRAIVEQHEVYRLWTGAALHSGILHIVFNLLAAVSLSPMLELRYGTAGIFVLSLLMQTLAAVLGVASGYAAAQGAGAWAPVWLLKCFPYRGCSIGLSGLLFSYITMHVHIEDTMPRSLFGFCSVPAKMYPWALLVILQILWPGVSLGGHLFGIVAGYAGFLYFGPHVQAVRWEWCIPSSVTRLECYKMGSGGLILSGVLHDPNASSGGRWMPSFMSSSSTPAPGRFPGQGRSLADGGDLV